MNDDDLRDLFAVMAMNGLIASNIHQRPFYQVNDAEIARCAYEQADQMLKVRNASRNSKKG